MAALSAQVGCPLPFGGTCSECCDRRISAAACRAQSRLAGHVSQSTAPRSALVRSHTATNQRRTQQLLPSFQGIQARLLRLLLGLHHVSCALFCQILGCAFIQLCTGARIYSTSAKANRRVHDLVMAARFSSSFNRRVLLSFFDAKRRKTERGRKIHICNIR